MSYLEEHEEHYEVNERHTCCMSYTKDIHSASLALYGASDDIDFMRPFMLSFS